MGGVDGGSDTVQSKWARLHLQLVVESDNIFHEALAWQYYKETCSNVSMCGRSQSCDCQSNRCEENDHLLKSPWPS